MNKLLLTGILLLLAGSASAAVYHYTSNPEANMFFALEADTSTVNPMEHTINGGTFWTNSLGLGLIPSDVTLVKDIKHANTGEDVYFARIFFTIECDEGISMESHTSMGEIIYDGIEDFTDITYKMGATTVECNDMAYIEVLSANKVKITPMEADSEFSGGYDRYGLLTLSFNDMAYGNYTVMVNTE